MRNKKTAAREKSPIVVNEAPKNKSTPRKNRASQSLGRKTYQARSKSRSRKGVNSKTRGRSRSRSRPRPKSKSKSPQRKSRPRSRSRSISIKSPVRVSSRVKSKTLIAKSEIELNNDNHIIEPPKSEIVIGNLIMIKLL